MESDKALCLTPVMLRYIAFCLAVSIGTMGCQKESAPPVLSEEALQTDVERIEQVEIIYSDSAVIRVRLKGPVMLTHLQSADTYQEFTEGVRIEFFSPGGLITSVMTAGYAVRYQSRGVTYIRKEVVWRSAEGKMLETPELIWDERERNVYTQKFAVVTTPVDTVYSHGFQATQDFRDIRLKAVDGSMELAELQAANASNQ
ncbi:MAG: hypothetical protein ACKOAY_05990 [Haliscomenobacter sp.]